MFTQPMSGLLHSLVTAFEMRIIYHFKANRLLHTNTNTHKSFIHDNTRIYLYTWPSIHKCIDVFKTNFYLP